MGSVYMLISGFNALITQHDEKLSGEICTLVSEKMSTSLLFMTDSAQNIADILSQQDFDSIDEIYETLNSYKSDTIVSLGFVDEEGEMYLSDSEKFEFEKMNLIATAKLANPVSISAPYRSTRLGQPVITMFTRFTYNDTHEGYLCLTYLFSTLQEAAYTDSLANDIEIWLMNAKSANIIQCVGSDIHESGSWANAYLKMNDINSEDKPAFDNWYNLMIQGKETASVSYKIKDIRYSQVYSVIDYMPGWYVVVRIPSNALSATMGKFRNYVIVFLFVFLNIVIILISIMYISGKRENHILGQLSVNDPLTGILNRRAFELSSEKMLNQTREATIIFFDIDYFKQVNDTYGHDIGDKLLVKFSSILKDNFSEHGIVSRYGGDEFVVLLNTSSVDLVKEALDSVKEQMNSIVINDEEDESKDFKISFSAGIARFPTDAQDISGLQQCADSALYNVKQKGRGTYLWFKS